MLSNTAQREKWRALSSPVCIMDHTCLHARYSSPASASSSPSSSVLAVAPAVASAVLVFFLCFLRFLAALALSVLAALLLEHVKLHSFVHQARKRFSGCRGMTLPGSCLPHT